MVPAPPLAHLHPHAAPAATLDLLSAALAYARDHAADLAAQTWRHVGLAGGALLVAALICVPAGVWIARHRRLAGPVIGLGSSLRVVPSLAILFLALPVLGLGARPALVALVLLACPPLLLNSYAGIRGVAPAVLDAARGMGMSPGQILRQVELPLALPLMLAGLRTATVELIASATLAAWIGGGGLGDFILRGFALGRPAIMLVGAVPVALMALAAELLLGRVQRRVVAWQ
jgi:osmoprotectant transport system permease protein